MKETSLVSRYWIVGLEHRGAHFAYTKNDGIYFIIDRGSTMDNIEHIQDLKEFMDKQYSYKLNVGYRN